MTCFPCTRAKNRHPTSWLPLHLDLPGARSVLHVERTVVRLPLYPVLFAFFCSSPIRIFCVEKMRQYHCHIYLSLFRFPRPAFSARFSDDDAPNTTDIQLEESAADNTDMEAIIVMDGISDAWVSPHRVCGKVCTVDLFRARCHGLQKRRQQHVGVVGQLAGSDRESVIGGKYCL